MFLVAGPRSLLEERKGPLGAGELVTGQVWPSPFASGPICLFPPGSGTLLPSFMPVWLDAGFAAPTQAEGGGFGSAALGEGFLCTAEICGEISRDLRPQQRLSKPSYFYGIPSCLQPASSSCYILSLWFIGALGAGIAVLLSGLLGSPPCSEQ